MKTENNLVQTTADFGDDLCLTMTTNAANVVTSGSKLKKSQTGSTLSVPSVNLTLSNASTLGVTSALGCMVKGSLTVVTKTPETGLKTINLASNNITHIGSVYKALDDNHNVWYGCVVNGHRFESRSLVEVFTRMAEYLSYESTNK